MLPDWPNSSEFNTSQEHQESIVVDVPTEDISSNMQSFIVETNWHVQLPTDFLPAASGTQQWYKNEYTCRLSYEVIDIEQGDLLRDWIAQDDAQFEYLTVQKRHIRFFDEHEDRAMVETITEETGRTVQYLQQSGLKIFDIRLFSSIDDPLCYDAIQNIVVSYVE